MPLIVAPDTTNPNRINITGDGFSFDVDGLGTRINIEGVGRTVTVTYANPRANIQWGAGYNIPSYFIRGFNDGTYYPILPDWSSGVTLGEVNNGDNLVVYEKIEFSSNWNGLTDIGAYGSKLYLTLGTLNPVPQVYCINLSGASTTIEDMFPVGNNSDNTSGVQTCVIDESTIYCVYNNDFNYNETTGGELFIAKITNGELVSETKIWNENEQWNSTWLYYSATYWITRQKYGDDDVLVINYLFDSDFTSMTHILGFVVYDLVTDTILNKEFIAQIEDLDVYADSDFWWYFPPPSGYKYYVICTTGTYANWDGEKTVGLYPSFLVDIRNGNITRLDDITDNFYNNALCIGAGLNKNTGIYYFTMWEHGATAEEQGDGWVGQVNLNSVFPAEATVGKFVDGLESGFGILQGDGSVYIDDWNATPTRILKNLPIFSQAEDISRPDWYGNVIIDSDQSRAYQCDYTDPTSLTGFNIAGVGSVSLNLTGGDGYAYASNRKTILIGIYNGHALVMVQSSQASPAASQRDFYIFGA